MMSPRRIPFWLSTLSLATLILPVSHAEIPLWTLTPLTPTALILSPTDVAEVDYLLTNQSRRTHRLVITPMAGIQQQTGPGDCSSPVTLGYRQSCRLALILEGGTLVNNLTAGPVVCQDGNPLQCYQPALGNRLTITLTAGPQPLSLLPVTLPTANLASAYQQTLAAVSGGNPPYVYSIISGALPLGLVLDPTTGVISGSATTAGTYTFDLVVTDSQDQRAEQSYTLLVSGFTSCTKIITSSLMTPNHYGQALTIRYLMVGGGGSSGSGASGPSGGGGGGGGSSAIWVDDDDVRVAWGGAGGTLALPGKSGLRTDSTQTLFLPSTSILHAIVGGGGGSGGHFFGSGGGGGGSGYYGGGGGGASGGNGGDGGSDGNGGSDYGGSGNLGTGGVGGSYTNSNATGGDGDNGGIGGNSYGISGGCGGGGGGGFGSGGGGGGGNSDNSGNGGNGGTRGSNGFNGTNNSSGQGGQGVSTFSQSMPLQEAGMGGQQEDGGGDGGNAGIIIIQYDSPTTTCLL